VAWHESHHRVDGAEIGTSKGIDDLDLAGTMKDVEVEVWEHGGIYCKVEGTARHPAIPTQSLGPPTAHSHVWDILCHEGRDGEQQQLGEERVQKSPLGMRGQ
jgi:hypothetical protein